MRELSEGGRWDGKLPPNYICHRCDQPGHWIQNCPAKEGRTQVKRSYGIPKSFLERVEDPGQRGTVVTRDGQLSVPLIDKEAYERGKEGVRPANREELPSQWKCPLCRELLTEAVALPCCHEAVCDKCITQKLLASDLHRCPLCEQEGVSPCNLIPHNYLRKKIREHHRPKHAPPTPPPALPPLPQLLLVPPLLSREEFYALKRSMKEKGEPPQSDEGKRRFPERKRNQLDRVGRSSSSEGRERKRRRRKSRSSSVGRRNRSPSRERRRRHRDRSSEGRRNQLDRRRRS